MTAHEDHNVKPSSSASTKAKASALEARVTSMIERELARCRAAMGDDAWLEHGDWVKDHVIAGARAWLKEQSSKGSL